jgi:hypothetical protein
VKRQIRAGDGGRERTNFKNTIGVESRHAGRLRGISISEKDTPKYLVENLLLTGELKPCMVRKVKSLDMGNLKI